MAFFALLIGFIGYKGIKVTDHASKEILYEALEIDKIQELRIILQRLIMPVNDYLITGEKEETDKFERLLTETKEKLYELVNIVGDEKEKMALAVFEEELEKIETLSILILSLENPVGNPEAGRMMKELDSLTFTVVDDSIKLLGYAKAELDEYIAITNRAEETFSLWVALLTIGLTIGGFVVAFFITQRIVFDIRQLVKVSEAVSRGDLTQSIKVKSRDEIGSLADSFNRMVKGLKASNDDILAEKTYSENLIENMTDSLMVIDHSGMIKTVNKATLDLLGYTEEEIIGFPVAKIIEEEEILNEIKESAILISKDFRIIKANQPFLDSVGKSLKEVINQPCYKITHNKDSICSPPYDTCPIEDVLIKNEPCIETHTHFDTLGRSFKVNVIAIPIRGRSGNVKFYLHISQGLKAEHEKGIITKDYRKKLEVLTDKLRQYALRLEGEKIITEGLADELFRLGSLKDMELFYKTKNNENIPVNFSGSVLKEEEKITGIIGIARDIRDLKKRIEYEKKLAIATASAEEGMKRALELEEMYHELEESKDAALNIMEDLDKQTKELQQEVGERKKTEKMLKKAYHEVELLANLVENAHEIVFIVESDGQILMSNSLAKEAFGYSKQELMDSNIMNLFKPDEDIKWETITDCVQRETHWRGNLIALKKYLGEFPAYVTFSAPVSGSGTGVENMICFIRDITEEKEIDRMKNEFISTVSHELRTPLSITREGISLIMDRITGEINEKQEELLGTAMSNIDRLARIINDLLDVSKIESGKLELKRGKIDIFNLINQIKSTFEHKIKEKGLDLRISYPREGLLAYADEDRINQVYINLINNAIKFTEKGYIELLVIEKEKEVECIVADTGIGISKEDMPRLFSKFQQFGRTAGPGDKGTGLGLSIVKSLIEMHGGKIETRSSLNKGTVFTFTIPKYSTWNIFREHVHAGIKDAASRESSFSLLYINMPNFIEIERELGKNKADKVFEEIIHKVKKLLRRTCDVLVEDHSDIFILLPDTSKQGAGIVLKRIELTLKDFIEACKFEELKKLKLNFKDFTYPDNVTDYEKLLNKVQEAKNEKEDTIHRG